MTTIDEPEQQVQQRHDRHEHLRTDAMRRTPPKTTRPVRTASAMPMTQGSHRASPPMLEVTVAAIVLACSELKAIGKQMIRMIANTIPIQRAFRPRCM